MSIRLEQATDILDALFSPDVPIATAFTFMFWGKPKASPGPAFGVYGEITDALVSPSGQIVYAQNNGDGDKFSGDTSAISTLVHTDVFTNDTWYHFIVCRTGSTIKFKYFADSTSTTPIEELTDVDASEYLLAHLLFGADAFDAAANFEVASPKICIGFELDNAEIIAEKQKFAWQKAEVTPGTDAWAWKFENIDADIDGLNEILGSGPNFSNTGCVNGASRPSTLESLSGPITETINEAASVTDASTANLIIPTSISEAGAITDAPSASLVILLTISEAGSVTDAVSAEVNPGGTLVQVSVDETGLITDVVSAPLTIPFTINEVGLIVDQNDTAILYDLPDEVGVASDAVTAKLIIGTQISEAGSAVDTADILHQLPQTISEVALAVDSLLHSLTIPTTVSESGVASDSVSVSINADNAPIEEVGEITDEAIARIIKGVSVDEAGLVIDDIALIINTTDIELALFESGVATDEASVQVAYALAINESGLIKDFASVNLPPSPGSGTGIGRSKKCIRRRRR